MKKNRLRLVQFLLVCFLVIFGQVLCTQAASVKLNKKKLTLYVGKSETLKVTGTSSKVKWSTANKKIATVTSKGKVTAKKAGKVTITAKVKNKKYTCKVTVKNVMAASKEKLTIGEKSSIKVTFKKNGTIRFKSSNPNVLTCKWSGKWKNNKTTLYLYGNKEGKATVTLSNTWSSEKLKINVTVKFPKAWDNVKVVLPDTIGDSGSPENRMQVVSYDFYDDTSYDDDYKMDVQFKLVQYGSTGRSNWGEYVYFYDKSGNLLDKEFLYAYPLALNRSFNDTLSVPAETAKIVFMEYPDETNTGTDDDGNTGNDNSNDDSTEVKKWSYTDAVNLNNYAAKATEYANAAFDDYNDTNSNAMLKTLYARSALSNISSAKSYLNKALELAKSRAELTTTSGDTLVGKIEKALASWDAVTYTSVDSSNVSAVCTQLSTCVASGNLNCLAVQSLSVDLLGAFTD